MSRWTDIFFYPPPTTRRGKQPIFTTSPVALALVVLFILGVIFPGFGGFMLVLLGKLFGGP